MMKGRHVLTDLDGEPPMHAALDHQHPTTRPRAPWVVARAAPGRHRSSANVVPDAPNRMRSSSQAISVRQTPSARAGVPSATLALNSTPSSRRRVSTTSRPSKRVQSCTSSCPTRRSPCGKRRRSPRRSGAGLERSPCRGSAVCFDDIGLQAEQRNTCSPAGDGRLALVLVGDPDGAGQHHAGRHVAPPAS